MSLGCTRASTRNALRASVPGLLGTSHESPSRPSSDGHLDPARFKPGRDPRRPGSRGVLRMKCSACSPSRESGRATAEVASVQKHRAPDAEAPRLGRTASVRLDGQPAAGVPSQPDSGPAPSLARATTRPVPQWRCQPHRPASARFVAPRTGGPRPPSPSAVRAVSAFHTGPRRPREKTHWARDRSYGSRTRHPHARRLRRGPCACRGVPVSHGALPPRRVHLRGHLHETVVRLAARLRGSRNGSPPSRR